MHHSLFCSQLLWYVFIDFSQVVTCLKLIYLFYADTMGNKGAYIILKGKDMKPQYEVYEAVPHPNGKNFLLFLKTQ